MKSVSEWQTVQEGANTQAQEKALNLLLETSEKDINNIIQLKDQTRKVKIQSSLAAIINQTSFKETVWDKEVWNDIQKASRAYCSVWKEIQSGLYKEGTSYANALQQLQTARDFLFSAKKRTGKAHFKVLTIDTLETSVVNETLDYYLLSSEGLGYEIKKPFSDSLLKATRFGDSYQQNKLQAVKKYKLRIRVEVLNYFNDNRPLVIKSIAFHDAFFTKTLQNHRSCGVGWDNKSSDIAFDDFVEIPILTTVKYKENNSSASSEFISNQTYVFISESKVFIFDMDVWTKPNYYKIICTAQDCEDCHEMQLAKFDKTESIIQFTIDKPDFNDNTSVIYNVKEYLMVK